MATASAAPAPPPPKKTPAHSLHTKTQTNEPTNKHKNKHKGLCADLISHAPAPECRGLDFSAGWRQVACSATNVYGEPQQGVCDVNGLCYAKWGVTDNFAAYNTILKSLPKEPILNFQYVNDATGVDALFAVQKAAIVTTALHYNRFYNRPTSAVAKAFSDQMGLLNAQVQNSYDAYVSLDRVARLILKSLWCVGVCVCGCVCWGMCLRARHTNTNTQNQHCPLL